VSSPAKARSKIAWVWRGLLLPCLAGSTALAVQINPPKLSGLARIDLNAAASVSALDEGAITTGTGSLGRQTWLPAEDWPLTYTLQVPIVRFGWNAFTVRFVPAQNGTVQLSLRGPWEEVTVGTGNIYQQEVLWDDIQVTGAELTNGGFETVTGSAIAGWSGGTSQLASTALTAVEGRRMGRSWHNDSLTRYLNVSRGVPVFLKFFARAYIPAGFTDMQPVADRNSAAHQTALKFMRGVNFGNALELPPGSAGQFEYPEADYAQARAEGFDHIRLPIAWQHHTGPAPDYVLSAAIFAKVDTHVASALRQGLGIMIDVHNFEDFVKDPPALTNKLYAMWRQIAAHYSNAPPTVVFEVLNEPRDAASTAVMNPIFAEAIRQIRLTNPHRTLFIGTGAFNGISELNNLILPDNDSNLIATVHTYDPFLFTHQGLPWAGTDAGATPKVQFPGPPTVPLIPAPGISEWATNWIQTYNTLPADQNPSSPAAFRGTFQFIRQWSDYYGRPVHIGEFGAFETADPQSRINYYHEKRRALDQQRIGWAIWDWKAGFHYSKNGLPDPPGLREALFPAPLLTATGPGAFRFEAALGKTFVIERTRELTIPGIWDAVSTQSVVTGTIEFSDSQTRQNPAAFYRGRWVK
jgi:endoglucanase